MTTARTVALLCSTMTLGLVTGVFALYAHTVMPGLASTDDRTFTTAYAALDRAIVNPWFMATAFLGALVCAVATTGLTHGTPLFWWAVAAMGLYLVAAVITVAVHLPLNDALKQAVAAGHDDPAAIRSAFDTARWEAWNYLRTGASAAAFALSCWTLVLLGRAGS